MMINKVALILGPAFPCLQSVLQVMKRQAEPGNKTSNIDNVMFCVQETCAFMSFADYN